VHCSSQWLRLAPGNRTKARIGFHLRNKLQLCLRDRQPEAFGLLLQGHLLSVLYS
jgi:hypothetical protein